jgi:nucleotide-binding universal stress UspA family protein
MQNRKEELSRQSKFNLRNEVRFLNIAETVDVVKKCEEGEPVEVILRVAKEVCADWVIAGMKIMSNVELTMFGSTSLALSRHSTIPLILVPEDACFLEPKTIALASITSNEDYMHAIDPLKELAEKFESKTYIVNVINDENVHEERRSIPGGLYSHLKTLHFEQQFVKDDDVSHGLLKFINDHEINMIAMTRQEHTLYDRLFVKSNTKAMLVQTQIPLIILPGSTKDNCVATLNLGAKVECTS